MRQPIIPDFPTPGGPGLTQQIDVDNVDWLKALFYYYNDQARAVCMDLLEKAVDAENLALSLMAQNRNNKLCMQGDIYLTSMATGKLVVCEQRCDMIYR